VLVMTPNVGDVKLAVRFEKLRMIQHIGKTRHEIEGYSSPPVQLIATVFENARSTFFLSGTNSARASRGRDFLSEIRPL